MQTRILSLFIVVLIYSTIAIASDKALSTYWVMKCKGDMDTAKIIDKDIPNMEADFSELSFKRYAGNCYNFFNENPDGRLGNYNSKSECLEDKRREFNKWKTLQDQQHALYHEYKNTKDICMAIKDNTKSEDGGFSLNHGGDISLLLRGKNLPFGDYRAYVSADFTDWDSTGNCSEGIIYKRKIPIVTTKKIEIVKSLNKKNTSLKFDLFSEFGKNAQYYGGLKLSVRVVGPENFDEKFSFDQVVGWTICD